MEFDADLIIVGAGAAGLAAAIFAAELGAPARILLLEGAPKLGAKILISGGGRCNVTHESVGPDDFHGDRTFVRHVLAAFGVRETVAWFASLGVPLHREETGKLFPTTNRARTVVEALVERVHQLGVDLRLSCRAEGVEVESQGGFRLTTSAGPLRGRRLLLAAGGQSLPRTGSDGSGWNLARQLGHSVTPTFPALVPLVLSPTFPHARLSGISHPVRLTVERGGKVIERREGSLLWTHFGISGPVVLDASHAWVHANREAKATLRLDFLPDDSFEEVDRWLAPSPAHHRRSLLRHLASRLPERVAEAVLEAASIQGALTISQLPREKRRTLAHRLHGLELPVLRARGWDFAEVTAGGVPLSELSFRTLESRLNPGLHLVGEMLDCDGRIGGFNFQWAWSTARVAGRAAVTSLARS